MMKVCLFLAVVFAASSTAEVLQPKRYCPPRVCIILHDPVCGSDGNTYSSRCIMAIAACRTGKRLTAVSSRKCEDKSKRGIENCFTICGAVYKPVCGSDGKTYSNECALKSRACLSGKKTTVRHTGICRVATYVRG